MSKNKPIKRQLYQNTLAFHRDTMAVRKMLRDESAPTKVFHVTQDFLKQLMIRVPRRTLKISCYTPAIEDRKHQAWREAAERVSS